MKKLIIGALALTAVIAGHARTLSPEEALQRVENGASAHAKAVVRTAPALVAEGSYKGVNSYYVFSNDKSAVILSASSLAAPVIGYMDRPVTSSTPMPEQLRWWLDKIGLAIAEAEAAPQTFSLTGISANGTAGLSGMKIRVPGASETRTAAKTDIAPMMKIYWDQGDPYNLLCPQVGNARCYTGCVATATAMAMKYHEFPEKGMGVVSTTFNNQTLSLNLSAKKFDWGSMLNQYTSSATTNQKNAVAYLMQAVGYAVNMNYGTDASGAVTEDVVTALVNNFGYDKAIDLKAREFYTNEDWEDMLYAELQAGRPVIYGGNGSDGGHQFICDGYRSKDGFFHFNWGWSGAYDGYFALSRLVPGGMGAGGNSDGFTQNQDMVTGVRPAVSGSVAPEAWMCVYGGKLDASVSGSRCTLSVTNNGMFLNASFKAGVFDIGYTLTDAAGKTSTYTITTGRNLNSRVGYYRFEFTLPSLADGVYHLAPVYRINGTGNSWLPMKNNPYNPQYIILTVSGSTITAEQGPSSIRPGEIVDWEFENASTNSGFVAGRAFDFSVDVTNPNAESQTKKLVAVVVNGQGYPQGEYTKYVRSYTLAGGESKRVTFTGEVKADCTPGEYLLAMVDGDSGSILISWNIDVTASSTPAGLAVTALSTNPVEPVVGEAFTAAMTLINNSSSMERGTVALHFCKEDPNDETQIQSYGQAGSTSIFLGVGSTQSYDLSCTVPADLVPGEYILAAVKGNSVLGYIMVNVVSEAGGVSDITVDEAAGEAVYYDMQGRRVTGTPAPGVYLRRTPAAVTKVVVK